MPFRPQDLHDFDVAQEVRIETNTADGRIRSTVIWVVADHDQLFVRSVRGGRGKWYQEALQDPHVTIDDRGRRLEARAVPVHDPDSVRRMNEGMLRKYATAEGYQEMLTPEAVDATVRLEPHHDGEVPLEAPAYLGSDEPSELGAPVEIGMLDGGPAIEENIVLQPHKPV